MPGPIGGAAGGSLSQSLDGALRRAKPKASLSRHLVGYRVAASENDVVAAGAIDEAADDPDARAAVARAAQSGEAAWAYERVSLIGRALDEEAARLAADPQKAGKVAEHLAPLIEKAFAAAEAEAPGDYARAIVGREREPLETALLAERAVMSVAATQRAEQAGRSATFADELARLKEQPQRWAAAHARQARAIDDLPLDEKRKYALKNAAARAQANAAAEGLLQQDATWLLEDLDDPEFANALGTDDTARWRSAAEEAVARRAERIAAESAERAQLAASDMRAALKRFKDKDDGPLPPRDAIVAALGDEAVADEMLSATLKGRKHRYAESAVALLPPADEGAWLDAAPDKETRTVRELAVATKRASVAGNPGRWLMKHSATLRELADAAVDDPAQLPRLVDHYAALRHQVRGRSGDARDGAESGTGPDTGATTEADVSPLSDAVAADLAEQVLAGETPQARLEALTTILDGAADGGSTDADDRARADAIARQLETLGLPEGTAARWAQLSDPHSRRSARLALLGGFAKRIAEEEKILEGEGENALRAKIGGKKGGLEPILDEEGDSTTKSEELDEQSLPEEVVATAEKVREIIAHRRRYAPGSISADFLEHYLDGEGATIWIDPDWLQTFDEVNHGFTTLQSHFERGLIDPSYSNDPTEVALVDQITNLADGDKVQGITKWDATLFKEYPGFIDKAGAALFSPDAGSDMDLWNAIGNANLFGEGSFEFIRSGDRILMTGTVTISLQGYDHDTKTAFPERYDWNPNSWFLVPNENYPVLVTGAEMIELEDYDNANVYDIISQKEYILSGEITIENGELRWTEPPIWSASIPVPPMSGSRVYPGSS